MQNIWDKIKTYTSLTEEGRAAWEKILRERAISQQDFFVREGQVPRTVGFVAEGLFSQYYTSPDGCIIIKRFFPENYFVASTSALLKKAPSGFTIKALENSVLLEYDFHEFKRLTQQYTDIAAFYIRYMEQHWIIEKEPLEISLRHDRAKTKYADFLKQFPLLEPRLKQHEIAAYLGITPTQLSRVRSEKYCP